jgi:cytochrome oxidase assembly protein ShyY1
MQARMHQPAIAWDGSASDNWLWQPVHFSGEIQSDQILFLPKYGHDCATGQNVWGYDLIYPVKLSGGAVIVLARMGWYSQGSVKTPPFNPKTIHDFTGVFRPFDPIPIYPPAHQNGNQWNYMASAMYAAVSAPELPFFLELTGGQDACHIAPLPDPGQLPDNHLQYAMTWFALAAALVGYYIYYLWKNRPIKNQAPRQ